MDSVFSPVVGALDFFTSNPEAFEATVLCGLNEANVRMALVDHGRPDVTGPRELRALMAGLGSMARRRFPLAAPAPRPELVGSVGGWLGVPGPAPFETRPYLVALGLDIMEYEGEVDPFGTPLPAMEREAYPTPKGWDVIETDGPEPIETFDLLG